MHARRAAGAGAVALILAVTGCGGDNERSPQVAGPSQDTAGIAITTTPAAPSASTPPPAGAAAITTTTAAATTAPTAPAGPAEYTAASAPTFPTRSAAPPSGSDLQDGTYYGVVDSAIADPAPQMTITIYELLTGQAAIDAAAADGEGLDSDVYVRPTPAAERVIDIAPPVVLTVAQPDDPTTSYAVSAGELVRLVGGATPGPGAPSTYRYIPFPYLVSVQGGAVVRVDQLWSP